MGRGWGWGVGGGACRETELYGFVVLFGFASGLYKMAV